MNTSIKTRKTASDTISQVFLLPGLKNLEEIGFNKTEVAYIKKKHKEGNSYILLNRFTDLVFIQLTSDWSKQNIAEQLEHCRNLGNKICTALNAHQYTDVYLNHAENAGWVAAVAEGIALSNYQFLKYKSDNKLKNSLETVYMPATAEYSRIAQETDIICKAVCRARTWVNEPQSYLNAQSFSREMKAMAQAAGIKCEVLSKKQIEALKMGGLLAVNKGSKTPPTFTILEYKPARAINSQPLVLVGKGVVYDTGGLSLKPTNSMDTMKCDMAGGAAVAAALEGIAQLKLPVHVMALIPATDNRPGEDAYTPGDVVHMYNGSTVEVLNTDAEGRMLLADALAYAKKYNPELVMDFATLTGAAAAAIGSFGTVCMGTAPEPVKDRLKAAGESVHERLVEFPFWDDYAKLLKSDIADMKNIGGPVGGAITAGKFLEKFTDYPWMHFDIAGPAFLSNADSYRGKQGTGTGVRLLIEFVKNYVPATAGKTKNKK